MRSLPFVAVCLSLSETTFARVPHSFRDLNQRDDEAESNAKVLDRVSGWLERLFRRDLVPARNLRPRQAETCVQDDYYSAAQDYPGICQSYMNYPTQTEYDDYTPISTTTTTYSTETVVITNSPARVTPYSTATQTVTAGDAGVKRDVAPQITARAASQQEMSKIFQKFRRLAAATNSTDSSATSASWSSACACQDYKGPTVTQTYTEDAITTTESAFVRTTTTVDQTRTAATHVVTTTITVRSASSASTGSSSIRETSTASTNQSTPANTAISAGSSAQSGTGGSTERNTASTAESMAQASTQATSSVSTASPTSLPFTCPADNGRIIAQMIGNERYDYLIECGTILEDLDLYGNLNYATFSECVAACSKADQQFDYPVCQGVSYGASSGDCFLKSSANSTSSATEFNSALLQRILIGVDDADPDGTSTESAPFGGTSPTQNSDEMSSMASTAMGNSTSSMPMVTPTMATVGSGRQAQAPITSYSTFTTAGSTYSSGTTYYFSTMYPNGSYYYYYYTSYTEAWASTTQVYGASSTGNTLSNSSNTEIYQNSGQDGEYTDTTVTNTTTHYPGGYNVTEVIDSETYDSNGTEISSSATTNYYHYATATAISGSGSGGGSGSAVNGTSSNSTSGGGSGGFGTGSEGRNGSMSSISTIGPYTTETIIVQSSATAVSNSTAGSGVAPAANQTVIINTYGTAYSSIIMGGGGGGGSGGSGSGGPTPTPVAVNATVHSYGTGGASSTFGSGGPTGNFSDIGAPRTGALPSSTPRTTPIPVFTSHGGGYNYTGPPVISTGTFTNTAPPRSPFLNTSTQSTSPVNSTTLPSYPTGPRPYPPYSAVNTPTPSMTAAPTNTSIPYIPPGYGYRNGTFYPLSPTSSPSASITSPRNLTSMAGPTAPPTTSTGTFSNTDNPRSGTLPPSADTTCVNMTMGTTTMFSTINVTHCDASCTTSAAQWGGGGGYGGYYGGPQNFGPPAEMSSSEMAPMSSQAPEGSMTTETASTATST